MAYLNTEIRWTQTLDPLMCLLERAVFVAEDGQHIVF